MFAAGSRGYAALRNLDDESPRNLLVKILAMNPGPMASFASMNSPDVPVDPPADGPAGPEENIARQMMENINAFQPRSGPRLAEYGRANQDGSTQVSDDCDWKDAMVGRCGPRWEEKKRQGKVDECERLNTPQRRRNCRMDKALHGERLAEKAEAREKGYPTPHAGRIARRKDRQRRDRSLTISHFKDKSRHIPLTGGGSAWHKNTFQNKREAIIAAGHRLLGYVNALGKMREWKWYNSYDGQAGIYLERRSNTEIAVRRADQGGGEVDRPPKERTLALIRTGGRSRILGHLGLRESALSEGAEEIYQLVLPEKTHFVDVPTLVRAYP